MYKAVLTVMVVGVIGLIVGCSGIQNQKVLIVKKSNKEENKNSVNIAIKVVQDESVLIDNTVSVRNKEEICITQIRGSKTFCAVVNSEIINQESREMIKVTMKLYEGSGDGILILKASPTLVILNNQQGSFNTSEEMTNGNSSCLNITITPTIM